MSIWVGDDLGVLAVSQQVTVKNLAVGCSDGQIPVAIGI